MEIFARLREKNKIISRIAAWQKSLWYPAVYAALGVLSCSCGYAVYVPVYYVLALSALFAALFCEDPKALLTPLLLSYFCAGSDGIHSYGEAVQAPAAFFQPAGLVNMFIAGAIIVASVLFRIIASGILADVFRRRGLLTFGLLCMAAAFLLNGAFSSAWQPVDLAYGALMLAGLLLIYFLVLPIADRSHGLPEYICRLCLICGLMICAQSWILMAKLAAQGKFIELDEAGNWTGGFVRDYQVLGWGVSTYAAGVLAFLIPPTMYLAFRFRRAPAYFCAAAFMFATIVALNARTSMLIGGVIFIACIVLCCVAGPNKIVNRYTTAFFAGIALLLGVCVFAWIGLDGFKEFVSNMLRFEQGDNHRFELWGNGWRDFLSAPVFGVGFADGGRAAGESHGFMYSNMYHNIFVQLIGSMGILGLLAFIIHVKSFIEILVRKFTVGRLLIGLGVIAVLATSLLDNFFFFFSIQLFYGALSGACEIDLEERRAAVLAAHRRAPAGKKPRVVFTFIEAGMGHIIPLSAVCNAVEEKYGDQLEVVRSQFYRESGDPALRQLEIDFADAVARQSRSKIYGRWCVFGNQLFGDTIAHEFVMSMLAPKSVKPAFKHLRELQADVVVTTHWGSSYYVEKLEKDKPYLIMYCPDLYSNGMFNMDCNDFLISTKEGLAQVRRQRMYAGGHTGLVNYPIREEAFALEGKRSEIRAQLGIPEDRFVVVLSDGGYGMAKLEKTVRALVRSNAEMTIMAVCGKNEAGAERLRALQCPENIDLRVFGFTDKMLEFLCMADLYVGKAGANSIAEPTFFGLPVILTKCITPIEVGTKKYYKNIIGNALFIPSVKKAAEKIVHFASHREELAALAANTAKRRKDYGAEQMADLIYERAMSLVEEQTPAENAEENKR